MLLDYVATYPFIYLQYHASIMTLIVSSDAAYLVQPESRSFIAGYYQLGELPHRGSNDAILVDRKTIKHGAVPTAEAKVGKIFHNS